MHTCSSIGKSSALKNGLRPTYLNIQGDLINCVILNLYESINLLALIASAPILSVFTHRCDNWSICWCSNAPMCLVLRDWPVAVPCDWPLDVAKQCDPCVSRTLHRNLRIWSIYSSVLLNASIHSAYSSWKRCSLIQSCADLQWSGRSAFNCAISSLICSGVLICCLL